MRSIVLLACVLGACGDDDATGVEVRGETTAEVAVEVEATSEIEVAVETFEEADVIEVEPLAPELAERLPANVDEGFVVHRLGAKPTVAGETADFTFDVPNDAVTLHVSLATTKGSFVVLLAAISPEGSALVFDEAPDGVDMTAADTLTGGFGGSALSPNKTPVMLQGTTTLIPNTPRVALTPGRWTFRAGSFDAAFDDATDTWTRTPVERDIEVAMLVRTKPVPTTGSIDLVLSFAAQSGLSAASARTDADIVASLDILSRVLGGVGVTLGEVTYRDVTLATSDLPMSPTCNVSDAIAGVFDEAPAPDPNAVHIIFVQHFTCTPPGGSFDFGDNIVAITFGYPSTPFATRSGIIASTFGKSVFEPGWWPRMIAHEVGHNLGLFHTRDNGGVVDNIADTAEDEAGAATNFMSTDFSQTATTLTPDQGKIVRSSPLVR